MALGLGSEYNDFDEDCIECELDQDCCTESCEARLFIGPCGTLDYSTGEILNIADFCEPQPYMITSITDNAPIREKSRQGCKKFRLRGQPDYSFDVTFDICQSSNAHGILLGRCPFDYVLAPKANNMNFELNPNIFDQGTKVFWGRVIGDTYSWEFPEDECQTTTRTFLTSGYCWETQIEALIPNAG